MRLILVGTPQERLQFRNALEHSALEIAAEFGTRAEALEADIPADGILEARADEDGLDEHNAVHAFDAPAFEQLTARELDVLELIAEGMPNKAIATRLGISD